VHTSAPRQLLALSLVALFAAVSLGQVSNITPLALQITSGDSPNASLSVPRNIGDIDGDDIVDQAYGSPFHDGSAVDAGLVQMRSGADNSALWSASGGTTGDLFGWSLAHIGDLDGDGVGEVVIGAPGTAGGSTPGQVSIHSGVDGTILHTFTGTAAGDRFGYAVDGVGDYDLDGKDDIVVGAPLEDANGVDSGAAYLFSGATFLLLDSAAGSAAADQFGGAVKGMSPDGVGSQHDPDIIVGATWGGPNDEGTVEARSHADFSVVNQILTGAAANDQFGISLAIPGDLDGDGHPDVLVGADPVDSNGGSTGTSYARVHSGDDGSLLSTVSGPTDAAFGRAVAGIADMDGDDIPDWAVGAPLDDENGTESGSLFVYSGADSSLLHTLHGNAGSQFGAAVCHAGDVDEDRLDDLLVAAPLDDGVGTDQGAVVTVSFTRFSSAGSGVPGLYGVPTVHSQGTLRPLSQLTLDLTQGRELANTALVMGHSLVLDPVHQTFVPLPVDTTTGLITDGAGQLVFTDVWPEGFAPGTAVYWQLRVEDAAAANGEALSELISGVTP